MRKGHIFKVCNQNNNTWMIQHKCSVKNFCPTTNISSLSSKDETKTLMLAYLGRFLTLPIVVIWFQIFFGKKAVINYQFWIAKVEY